MHLLQAGGRRNAGITREFLAGEEGLEPSNAGIKIRCLNQLGDSPTQLLVLPDINDYPAKRNYATKAKSGWVSKLAATVLFQPGGNLD